MNGILVCWASILDSDLHPDHSSAFVLERDTYLPGPARVHTDAAIACSLLSSAQTNVDVAFPCLVIILFAT